AIRLALGPDLPKGCRLVGPEPRIREEAVAKYGILDLSFTAPGDMLAGKVSNGVPVLRELGYLPGSAEGPQSRVYDDQTGLEVLKEYLAEGRTWLRLFLEGGKPGNELEPDGAFSIRVPAGYLPRQFRVVDACVTNARCVWLWKHFYL